MEPYLGEEAMETPLNATPNTSVAPAGPVPSEAAETERVVVVVVLGLLTLLTALVNAAVIAAICTTRKLQLPANYLICSLAVTDLLVALLVMPLSVAAIGLPTWTLGLAVCEAWLSVDMTCCTSSILHLCVIALDRFWAITKAVEYARKRTVRRAAAMVALVWLLSVLISLPPLLWRHRPPANASDVQCIIQHEHVGYTIYSTLGAFYIPMGLLLVLYYRIYSTAKTLYQKRGSSRHLSSRSGGSQHSLHRCRVAHPCCAPSDLSHSEPSADLERFSVSARVPSFDTDLDGLEERSQICTLRERRAARTLGLILGAFLLCWLPFFIKELLVGLRLVQPSAQLSDLLTWLGYVNSLVNPLLYTSFNEDFKLAFKRLVRRKGHT